MLSVIANIPVKEEACEEFETGFAGSAATVLANEPGCLLYQLCKDPQTKGKYTVLELYADRDALDLHSKNHAENRNPKLPEMLDGALVVSVLSVVGNPGLKAGDKPTVGVVAELKVKADAGADFEAAVLSSLMGEVHSKEAGNLYYCLGKDPEDPTRYVFAEMYTETAALGLHRETDHYKATMKILADFMGGPPKVSVLDTVGEAPYKPTFNL